jgi:hypothetical protein
MSPIGNPSRNARKRNPTAAHRRALELLAIADGATEAILLAHGFTIELMVELIRARLATQAEAAARSTSRGCQRPATARRRLRTY